MDLDELYNPVVGPVEAPAFPAVGPALKPSERSSGAAARRVVDELVAAQSAKAPESEGNLLVVATTICLLMYG